MSGLKFILFNVERGLCVFIRTPTDYGIMIDCGRSQYFSPVDWLVENEAPTLTRWNGFALNKLIVTHPHDDHVEDIDNLTKNFTPAMLDRQKEFDWNIILNPPDGDPSLNANYYYKWQQSYNQPVTVFPNLGIELETYNISYKEAKQINPDIQHALNNSSYVSVLTYQTINSAWKFVISGDIETAGWLKLLENDRFCESIKGVSFFVTSHHGHNSGFCSNLYNKMGLPWLNLSSEKPGDESVCSSYSSNIYAKGVLFGETTRYHLTTRKDGSMIVTISYQGECNVSFLRN